MSTVALTSMQRMKWQFIISLVIIAMLVTACWFAMNRLISEKHHYMDLATLAEQQSGQVSRLAFFATIMATTEDIDEFTKARSQVGRSINKLKSANQILSYDANGRRAPRVVNDNLCYIYKSPSVNLEALLKRYLEHTYAVYNADMDALHTGTYDYLYVSDYGPHALEPILDAVADEYDRIAKTSTNNLENLMLGGLIVVLIIVVVNSVQMYSIGIPRRKKSGTDKPGNGEQVVSH